MTKVHIISEDRCEISLKDFADLCNKNSEKYRLFVGSVFLKKILEKIVNKINREGGNIELMGSEIFKNESIISYRGCKKSMDSLQCYLDKINNFVDEMNLE